MLLCLCANVSENEYKEFLKDPYKFYSDDDFMIKINYMGYGCGSCIDAFEKINKEILKE